MKPPKKPAAKPVADDFRKACHESLDRYLTDHPGTVALMIAGAGGTSTDAVAVPNANSLMRGMVADLFEKFCTQPTVLEIEE